MLERLKPTTAGKYLGSLALSGALFVAGFVTSFEGISNDVRPGMYAPPVTSADPADPVEEPAEDVIIGEPTSALGKAIVAEFGEADFMANEKRVGKEGGHDPAEVQPDSGRVQDPLHGDMVVVPLNHELKEEQLLSLDVDGTTYWLMVDSSRPTDGYTVLQILLPEHEPKKETDPVTGEAPETTFTAATAQEALDKAGAAWNNNGMPLSDDIAYNLDTYGVTLSATTASEVTIKFDGGEYTLKRLGDRGIYFIM